MKMKRTALYTKIIIVLALLILFYHSEVFGRTVKKEEKFEKHLSIESSNGINARFFDFSGQGQGKTFLEKNELIIATLDKLEPVSWHPHRDILLVKEIDKGSNNRCYLLNIEEEEFEKKESNRSLYILGDQYSNKARWSEDGGTLTLYSTLNDNEYTYEVSNFVNLTQQ